jgi:alpha-mannosidase
MALTIEWQHRVELWQKALWEACYHPLGRVEFTGFTTLAHLMPNEATQRPFHAMPVGTPWGAKWEYGWFKTSIIIPSEAEEKRLVIRLDPGGLESLVWINGRAFGSFGWGHREITLAMKACPGERFDILMESYAGHGETPIGEEAVLYGSESVPEPGLTQAVVGESTFGVWREEIYQAAIDFTTLFELSQRLDPLSLRAAEIDQGLMETTLLVDPELPEEELIAAVRLGRERMRPLLARPNGPTMPTLYAFGHAHIDVAWLWPLQHTERKMAMTALNQLLLFDEYPEFKFLQSQPHLYWMLQERYPEIYQRFKQAIKEGKVIADGGMWVESDTNLTSGESLIRQILYGRRFYQDELGVDSRVLWLPDVFGYSGALPQILKGCGMRGFATQKITWAYNGGEPFPYNTFWWEGIDGSAIPAHIFTEYNSEMRPNAVMERWNTRLQKNGINSMILAFGWGDGGGGPTRDHLEFYRRVQDLEGLPKVKMASPAEFFGDLEQKGMPEKRYVGELYFQAHRGTYTSQARTKRLNRRGEFALREAEFWGAVARVRNGFAFSPQTLFPAWRNLMLNQFHDVLPGSAIQRVYEDAHELYEETLQAAEGVARAATGTIASADGGRTVFNSLSWSRQALVESNAGVLEVDVPACGWATIPAGPMPANDDRPAVQVTMSDEGFILENDSLRATFDRQGKLISLWDDEVERELMAAPGNCLSLYRDLPTKWDAWDIDSMAESQPVATDEQADITILSQGPLVARVKLQRRLHQSTVDQVISLRRGSRRIDFDTTIDWQESHKLLKVSFPVEYHTNEVISEIQFGHLRRPNHPSRQYDADRFEMCNYKWSALAEEGRGFAILNDSKYGLSAKGKSLNLTLLKSALAPDATADKGLQQFTYAIYSWNSSLIDSGVVRQAYDLNVPVLVVDGSNLEGAHSVFSLDNDNIVLETVKPAEDGSGDIILRLYEAMRTTTRCILTTSLPVSAALHTNLLEENIAPLEFSAGKLVLDFRPFEIKTIRLHFS